MAEKLLFTLFLCLLLVPLGTQAQEAGPNHSLQSGARALQFQITDDVNLESFSGTILSFKWQRTNRTAYRAGLSLNGDYSTNTRESGADELDNSRGGFDLLLNFSWMNYINPQDDVKFYYGYGPQVGGGYNQRTVEDSFDEEKVKRMMLSVGGLGYAGVEWFFQKSMSIHAEYQASVRYLHINQNIERDQGSDNKETSRGFHLGGDGVVFGVSVYF